MKLFILFSGALFLTVLSGCSVVSKENEKTLLIQLCSVDGVVHSAQVQIIKEYEGASSSAFCNNNTQCSRWDAKTLTGEPVVTVISTYSQPDAIVVNDLIWPINTDLIKEQHWTDWYAPKEQSSDEFYAIKRVNGYKLTFRTVSDLEDVKYRLRFKWKQLNSVDERLDEIPSCK